MKTPNASRRGPRLLRQLLAGPELEPLFRRAEDEFKALRIWMESREVLVLPFVDRQALGRLMDSLFRLWPASAALRSADPAWRRLLAAAGLPERGCQVCGDPRAGEVHLAADLIRGRSGRDGAGRTDHPVNCVALCRRHRRALAAARGPLSGELLKLLVCRRRLSRMVRELVRAELAGLRRARALALSAWSAFEAGAGGRVSRLTSALRRLA